MCSWLRGLRYKPEGTKGTFSLPNSSSSTMALGFTQPLTEMNTRYLPRGKAPPARKADNLTAICEPTVSQPYRPQLPVTEIALLFTSNGKRFN
jgi:hypothetical protein